MSSSWLLLVEACHEACTKDERSMLQEGRRAVGHSFFETNVRVSFFVAEGNTTG